MCRVAHKVKVETAVCAERSSIRNFISTRTSTHRVFWQEGQARTERSSARKVSLALHSRQSTLFSSRLPLTVKMSPK